jgi:hypothetical protein
MLRPTASTVGLGAGAPRSVLCCRSVSGSYGVEAMPLSSIMIQSKCSWSMRAKAALLPCPASGLTLRDSVQLPGVICTDECELVPVQRTCCGEGICRQSQQRRLSSGLAYLFNLNKPLNHRKYLVVDTWISNSTSYLRANFQAGSWSASSCRSMALQQRTVRMGLCLCCSRAADLRVPRLREAGQKLCGRLTTSTSMYRHLRAGAVALWICEKGRLHADPTAEIGSRTI